MMKKVRLLTSEGQKQNWQTEVGRDLGSDGLSLHKCLDYTNICTCQNILNSAVMICAFHCL